MLVARTATLLQQARDWCNKALRAADAISLSHFTENLKYARSKGVHLLMHEPGYQDIEAFHGIKAWAAVLAVDLRRSSQRAMRIGPRDTFITMHTYLPLMLELVDKAKGIPLNLRGDGAIACFGLIDLMDRTAPITAEESEKAITDACDCGDAMVKAVSSVLNPTLSAVGIEAGLRVGVGIDVGNIVATNIGLQKARELTAYGMAVNNCCKRSYGTDAVILTNLARRAFPKRPGGRTTFNRYPGQDDAYILHYPSDYNTLK